MLPGARTLTSTKRQLGTVTGAGPNGGCTRYCGHRASATGGRPATDRFTIAWTGGTDPQATSAMQGSGRSGPGQRDRLNGRGLLICLHVSGPVRAQSAELTRIQADIQSKCNAPAVDTALNVLALQPDPVIAIRELPMSIQTPPSLPVARRLRWLRLPPRCASGWSKTATAWI